MELDVIVELEGVDGSWWTLAGPEAGDRGAYLATGVKGLFDPPVKVVWEEPGNWPGSRYLTHRVLRRDLVFGVEILNDEGADSWMSRDSEWRKAWAFDQDCKLYVTTTQYGRRYLKVRLGESPEVDMFTDPTLHGVNRVAMVTVAADPFWYSDDEVYTAVTKNDTRFDPNALQLPWPWPQRELPKETLFIDVPVVNPTDQVIYPKWTVPGSTEKPAEPYIPGLPWLGAPKSPATIWTIPDYTWNEDDEHYNRRVRLPGLIGGLRTNEVQQFAVDGRPTGGTYRLKFGSETTVPIRWDAGPADIENALVALAGIARDDVQVDRLPWVNERQTVELKGGATGGTFTLTFDGQTTAPIPFNANAGQVYGKLEDLAAIGSFDVSVKEESQDCEQLLTMVGEPTAGTFTLTLDGQTTEPIPFNASDGAVYGALSRLPNIGTFDVAVSGSPLFGGGGPWRVKFFNGLSGVAVNKLVANVDNLSGGAGIDVKVKVVKPGGTRYTISFGNKLGGFNLPQLVGNPAGLTGGKNNAVEVKTVVDGARPFRVRFMGELEGIDVPLLGGDVSGLTGGTNVRFLSSVITEGHTAPAENAVIDTDPRVEQVVSESGSQLWARMNGVRFKHSVPPYTGARRFELTVSGCEPGQMVSLRLPRPWSRPWGLE